MEAMQTYYREWKKNLSHAYTSVMDEHLSNSMRGCTTAVSGNT